MVLVEDVDDVLAEVEDVLVEAEDVLADVAPPPPVVPVLPPPVPPAPLPLDMTVVSQPAAARSARPVKQRIRADMRRAVARGAPARRAGKCLEREVIKRSPLIDRSTDLLRPWYLGGHAVERDGGFRPRAPYDRVLSVHPKDGAYPRCDVAPAAGDATVILVSHAIR